MSEARANFALMAYKHPREIERFENLALAREPTFKAHRGQKLNLKKPGYKECSRCEADFYPTDEEQRPGEIRLCPKCRGLIERRTRVFGHEDFSETSDSSLIDRWWLMR